MRALLCGAARSAAATLLVLAFVEGALRLAYRIRNAAVEAVPLPYVFGQGYGPVPPWLDGLRLLEPDPVLLWRGRPGVRRTYVDVFSPVERDEERTALLRQFRPVLPESLRGNPAWEVALNADGFRDDELPVRKAPRTFRVVCLGDSWTFGANVGQDDGYPQQLERLLERHFPGAGFEVLNLGVLGYSSHQGLELLRSRAIGLEPYLLVLAFAMNDASVAAASDEETARRARADPSQGSAAQWLEHVEIARLLRYVALLLRYRPTSLGELLASVSRAPEETPYLSPGAAGMLDYERFQTRSRVSLADYERNLRAMLEIARERGIGVVALYNELSPNSPYRRVLREVAQADGVPFVDASALLAEARRAIEDDLERRLGLRPPPGAPRPPEAPVAVVLRVYAGERAVPGGLFVAGADEQLGALVPNRVAMHDDGTHGDQRAGDRVWSYRATFPVGARVYYVYTNGGAPGAWRGLDVPEVRGFRVEAERWLERHRPIEVFGRVHMQADSWHTNAAGHRMIAEALLHELEREPRVRRHLAER